MIRTDRLLVRRWRDADSAPFAVLNADPAGYVTEAAREALRLGFEAVGLPEIVSFTVPQNERS